MGQRFSFELEDSIRYLILGVLLNELSAGGGTRTPMPLRTADFESAMYTNFITPAHSGGPHDSGDEAPESTA